MLFIRSLYIIPIIKFPIEIIITFNNYLSYNRVKNKLLLSKLKFRDRSYFDEYNMKIYALGIIIFNYYDFHMLFKVKIKYYDYQIKVDYFNPNK